MKKNETLIFKILFLVCIFFLIYNFLNIIKWNKENRKSNEIFENIRKDTSIVEKNNIENIVFINPDKDKNSLYWYYASFNFIDVDLNNLLMKNDSTIGWIQVPGTNVNYPFVQSTNNNYYLKHSFDNSYNDAGWVFLDYRNNIKLTDKNNIIYGHARKDGTMFGSLKNILKNSWYMNIDNHIIKISTQYENSLWQIFSVYYIDTESYYINVNFNNEDFQQYLDTSLERSIYNFEANVNIEDKIITLSTCHGEKKKLVVQAKLIKKEIKSS